MRQITATSTSSDDCPQLTANSPYFPRTSYIRRRTWVSMSCPPTTHTVFSPAYLQNLMHSSSICAVKRRKTNTQARHPSPSWYEAAHAHRGGEGSLDRSVPPRKTPPRRLWRRAKETECVLHGLRSGTYSRSRLSCNAACVNKRKIITKVGNGWTPFPRCRCPLPKRVG